MAKGLPKTANIRRYENETDEQFAIRQMVAKARLHLLSPTGELYPARGTVTRFRFPDGIVAMCGEKGGYTAHAEYLANDGRAYHVGLGKQIGTPCHWSDFDYAATLTVDVDFTVIEISAECETGD